MRTLVLSMIAMIACLSFAGCASNSVGTFDAAKVVMDDASGTTGGTDGGGEDNPDYYIWYDSEGDDFD